MTANHVLLRRITLTASASSITFDSIPQTGYTDLKIAASARTNRADVTDGLNITFNSGGTYTGKRLYGSGSGVASDSSTTGMPFMDSASATANTFGNVEIYIPNYTSSNAKTLSVDGVSENNATAAYAGLGAKLWSSTAAVTSVTIAPEVGSAIEAGSSFSLYGIADVNTTPTAAPKADGGDIIKTDGTYWYHAFLSTGTFKPQLNLTCDYVVVGGGGGGGGYYHGAGGGAGGLRATTNQSVAANSLMAVTIGAGGAGGAVGGGAGTVGGASTFNSFSASGGGGGGSTRGDLVGFTGIAGGSGGGAPSYNSSLYGAGNAGSYSPVEGYAGGTAGSSGAPYYGAGGGGGASAVGSNGSSSAGGAGGAGTDTYNSINFSTWLTATGTGSSSKLAGGGGGSAYSSGSYGAGGVGGGGRGANQSGGTENPAAGVANTGGGGGGSERSGSGIGGAGGSGIIIIRYPVA